MPGDISRHAKDSPDEPLVFILCLRFEPTTESGQRFDFEYVNGGHRSEHETLEAALTELRRIVSGLSPPGQRSRHH